jgi:hydrogenase maturation protein HypF
VNTIETSCGRLFDAAASIAGLRQQINFEGRAAIELEATAADGVADGYPFGIDGDAVDFRPTIERIVAEVRGGTPAQPPPNGGGIALGQAVVATEVLRGIR